MLEFVQPSCKFVPPKFASPCQNNPWANASSNKYETLQVNPNMTTEANFLSAYLEYVIAKECANVTAVIAPAQNIIVQGSSAPLALGTAYVSANFVVFIFNLKTYHNNYGLLYCGTISSNFIGRTYAEMQRLIECASTCNLYTTDDNECDCTQPNVPPQFLFKSFSKQLQERLRERSYIDSSASCVFPAIFTQASTVSVGQIIASTLIPCATTPNPQLFGTAFTSFRLEAPRSYLNTRDGDFIDLCRKQYAFINCKNNALLSNVQSIAVIDARKCCKAPEGIIIPTGDCINPIFKIIRELLAAQ